MNINIKLSVYILLFSTITFSSSIKPISSRLKELTANLIFYPFISGNASDQLQEQAQSLMKQLDERKNITKVKKLNKLGQLLFGYKNSIAIPFLNVIILNEDWVKTLDDDSKKFLIGFNLIHLIRAKEYLFYYYLFPIAIKNFLNVVYEEKLGKAESDKETPSIREIQSPEQLREYLKIQAQKKFGSIKIEIILNIIAKLLIKYFSQSFVYNADIETAYKLNCPYGAIKLFKDMNKLTNDKSTLASLCSIFPILQWLNLLVPEKKASIMLSDPLTLSDVSTRSLLTDIKFLTPGKFTNISNSFENFFMSMPFCHYFTSHPAKAYRVANLRKIAEIIKNKNKDQLNKQ